jgi:hypothetical protein
LKDIDENRQPWWFVYKKQIKLSIEVAISIIKTIFL